MDVLIAATAVAHRLVVVTRNVRGIERLGGKSVAGRFMGFRRNQPNSLTLMGMVCSS